MIKYTEKCVIKPLFLFIAFHILCIESPYSMDTDHNENIERQWSESLDIYDHTGEHNLHKSDSWFANTFVAINSENEKNISSKCSKPTIAELNLASARFTIIGSKDDKIHFFSFDLDKIFVSGLNALDSSNKEVISEKLLETVIFPITHVHTEGKRPGGGEIDKRLREKVNTILGKNLVIEGTHSEESILITLDNNLHTYLAKAANGKPLIILGTILEISSFKDPCSDVCIPMLKAFMDNIYVILTKKNVEHIKISSKLENLVLVSGRKSHKSKKEVDSRTGMNIKKEKIKFNFEAPSNRLFSKKSD